MLSRWKLSYRVTSLVVLNFLFIAGIAGFALLRMGEIGNEITEIAEADVPITNHLSLASMHQLRQVAELEGAMRAGGMQPTDARARLQEARELFEGLEAQLAQELSEARDLAAKARSSARTEQDRNEFGTVLERLDVIGTEHSEYRKSAQALLEALGQGRIEDALAMEPKVEQEQKDLVEALTSLEAEVGEFTRRAAIHAEETEQSAARMLVLVLLIGLAAGLILGFLISRGINQDLTACTNDLGAVSTEMQASVQEQSASTSETASSVSQTSTTLDELRQTAESAAERSRAVSEVADGSLNSAGEAQRQVAKGVEVMQKIRDEVEGIARDILELSERNLQIGEIVQSVNAIAEQSNLLAVNASIEAAKAGDQGRGFSVVAGEVRALAEQSKEATEQIRTILAETQKASNSAVMVTEQGTKRAAEGVDVIEGLGAVLESLVDAVEEAADSARAIAMTANQQLAGIEQISSAMSNIEQATRDNAAGAAQLEQAAASVRGVSSRLEQVVEGRDA